MDTYQQQSMEKKNTINQQSLTPFEEAMQQVNWGAGNRSYSLPQGQDKYLAGTANSMMTQPQEESENLPRPEGLPEGISLADIARLAEMFRT